MVSNERKQIGRNQLQCNIHACNHIATILDVVVVTILKW